MFSISQDFAPPFKLIAPYFMLGSFFYLFSSLYVFFFGVDDLSFLDMKVISFVHVFLLGFVMMTIFGAMAQLVPVVLEVGHFGVELFYVIWPLLLIGTLLMAFGFLQSPALLPYGGIVVLIAMMIFVMEIFLTTLKVKKLNVVMSGVLISNAFLFFGVIIGLVMALTYAGTINADVGSLLKAHVYLVIGGYVAITVMSLSVVLIPMFGLSHGFSMRPLEISIGAMSVAVILVVLSSFVVSGVVEYLGYSLAIISLLVYFYFVYSIYKTRARKEMDVYARSLIFSYLSLAVSLFLGGAYLLSGRETLLLATAWQMFFGFFGFLITGHAYKIIPFLVWFERFSPLVGKQKVPMLADMVPKRSSSAQFLFSSIGVSVVLAAILLQSDLWLKAGASFLLIGALAFVRSVFYMINFR